MSSTTVRRLSASAIALSLPATYFYVYELLANVSPQRCIQGDDIGWMPLDSPNRPKGGLWSVRISKGRPQNIQTEAFNSKHDGMGVLVQLGIIFSAWGIVREAKMMGFSSPDGNRCKRTASTPYDDASQRINKGFWGHSG